MSQRDLPTPTRGPIKPGSDEDWQPFRDAITEKYSSMTLADLMQEMEERHAFKATRDQYKNIFRKWRIDKKRIKGDEYMAMLKKRGERARKALGKETLFVLRGLPVPSDNIARFEKRARIIGKVTDATDFSGIAIPDDLEWVTPPASPRARHEVLATTPDGDQSCSTIQRRLTRKQNDMVPLFRPPSPSEFDWMESYVNWSRCASTSVLDTSLLYRISSQRQQLVSCINDIGHSEIFRGAKLSTDFLVNLLSGLATRLDNYEDQRQYDQLADETDHQRACTNCWITFFVIRLEDRLSSKTRSLARFIGACVDDLLIRNRRGQVTDAIGFLYALGNLCMTPGLFDTAIPLSIIEIFWHRSSGSDRSDLAKSSLLRIAISFTKLGDIPSAAQVMKSQELQGYQSIRARASLITCSSCRKFLQDHPSKCYSMIVLLSTPEEIDRNDMAWLRKSREAGLRLEYAYVMYNIERYSAVMLALTECDFLKLLWKEQEQSGKGRISELSDDGSNALQNMNASQPAQIEL